MEFNQVKVSGKMTADTFGCEEHYFQRFIKGKALLIISSYSTNYIRVKDQNEEEWGLFSGQYALITGLGGQIPQQNPKETKAKLSRQKT